MDDDNLLHLYNDADEHVLTVILTESGKIARANGEKISFEAGHFNCTMDMRAINRCKF